MGAIIVGLAIVVGLSMFTQGARIASRDVVRQGAIDIASRAQAWYRTPKRDGGGDGSFAGFNLNKIYFDSISTRGQFSISEVRPDTFRITGFSHEDNDWKVVVDVTADNMIVVQ